MEQLTVYTAFCPTFTVIEDGESEIAKSATVRDAFVLCERLPLVPGKVNE